MTANETWGSHQGRQVHRITLRAGAITAVVSTYGARLVQLWVPDRDGRAGDVVLGFDEFDGYLSTGTYAGAICGRYGNRIAASRCIVDGRALDLDANEGPNHLHGGSAGLDKRVWTLAEVADDRATFEIESPDGDMGYPGDCRIRATYALGADGTLTVTMEAEASAPTPLNIVQHAYVNLTGQPGTTIEDHVVTIAADHYTPVNDALLPTGEIRTVSGTPFDLRRPGRLGDALAAVGADGFDHNWCLSGSLDGDGLRPCLVAHDPASGRHMALSTNQPGVQFFTAAPFDGSETGKGGEPLGRHAGFTLETQCFPDTPNNPQFPGGILRPGEAYRHVMVFRFSAD